MTISQRSYKEPGDLFAIGALIRRIYTLDPYWNSWSFALYDIWSQRKLGDEFVFGNTEWHQDIRIWEDERIGIVGAAIFRDPHLVKLVVFPEYHDLMVPMLDWVEERFHQKMIPDKQLTIETIETNPFLEKLLVARDYEKESGHYIFREKILDSDRIEPVVLPSEFTIKHIETAEDLKRFHYGTELVFNFPDNPDVYEVLRQAPSFVPELDLIVLSPDREIAAIGSVWFDRELSLAEFEPVGTVPEFRKLGLSSALIAEACNRLRGLGCQKVTVMSWSESAGANRIYEKAGLLPKVKINYWKQEHD